MAYVGVNSIARKISKAYVGVDSVAHKIKKAYVGIGGVARPCFSSGSGEHSFDYYGTVTPLSVARGKCAAVRAGNYALFAGGNTSSVVDAYDATLTQTQAQNTTSNQAYAASTFNDVAVLRLADGVVEAFTGDLSKLTLPNTTVTGVGVALASTSQYAFFGGGIDSQTSTFYNTVDAYSTSYTKFTVPALSYARRNAHAVASQNYCIFAGGPYSNASSDSSFVDAYNNSLTKMSGVGALLGSSVSSLYADIIDQCFSGEMLVPSFVGQQALPTARYLNKYSDALTRTYLQPPVELSLATCTSNDVYCLYYTGGNTAAPLLFDTSFTITTVLPGISGNTYSYLSSVAIGNYFLLAGGETAAQTTNDTVDAYITEGD